MLSSTTAATELVITTRLASGLSSVASPDPNTSLVLLQTLDDAESTLNSGGDELVGVVGTEVERRGGVSNTDNTLDGIVEGAGLRSASAGKVAGKTTEKTTCHSQDAFITAPYHPLTVAMSSTMVYSKGVLDSLNSLERYSPFSFERTVPRTGKPASRKALTV